MTIAAALRRSDTVAQGAEHGRAEHGRAEHGQAENADRTTVAIAKPQRTGAGRVVFRDLSLGHKVALIPALTLLLMGLMLAVGVRTGARNTAALSTLDRDVFEPLNRAQTLKDGITQLHTRLFALLSLGTNQSDPAAQKAAAGTLLAQLDEEVTSF